METESNPMTHETWQLAYLNSNLRVLTIRIIFKDLEIWRFSPILSKIRISGTWTRTWEPVCTVIVYSGPVLGNLDPYLGTWTRTQEL